MFYNKWLKLQLLEICLYLWRLVGGDNYKQRDVDKMH